MLDENRKDAKLMPTHVRSEVNASLDDQDVVCVATLEFTQEKRVPALGSILLPEDVLRG